MFLVVLSTAWWATSVKSADEQHSFNEAVDDIRWVIERRLILSSKPSASNIIQDTRPPKNTPEPMPIAPFLVCSEGKRQPRPSRRAREAYS